MTSDLVGQSLCQFRIIEELARGGMGVVYRAHDEKLGREVALKVIHSEVSQDPRYRRRLMREAKAAAAINHPSIATVHQIEEDDGHLFIAMELVNGLTLADVLDDGPLPVERAMAIGIEIARGLEVAHRAGVIHRDMKPENIVVMDDGHVKILDFGIARVEVVTKPEGEADTALTAEGTVMGTPGYMSPEQAIGVEVGPATDIFSVGVVLYELLAGTRPFEGKSLMETVIAVNRDTPEPLSNRSTGIPSALSDVVMRCLSKRPEERYASAAELEEALESVFDEVGVALPSMRGQSRPGSPSQRREAPAATLRDAERPPSREEPSVAHARSEGRGRWWLVLAAAALAAGGALWWRKTHTSTQTPPAASGAVASASATAMAITDLPLPASKSPEAVEAYKRTLSAMRDGYWRLARGHIDEALKHDDSMAAAHMRRAMVSALYKDPVAAHRHLKQASIDRSELTTRDRALLHAVEPFAGRATPDWKEMATRLREATKSFPNDAEFFGLLSYAAYSAGRLDETVAAAEQAIALDPVYADPHQLLGVALSELGRFDDAVVALERCMKASATAVDCVHDLVRIKGHRGECRAVTELAKIGMSRNPEHGQGPLLLAGALVALGEPLDAVERMLQDAAKRYGDEDRAPQTARGRRFIALMRGDFNAAAKASTAFFEAKNRRPHFLSKYRNRMLSYAIEAGNAAAALALATEIHGDRYSAESAVSDIFADPLPLAWRELAAAGKIDATAQRELREEWMAGWKERGSDDSAIWSLALAIPAKDEQQAREALRRRPASFDVKRHYRRHNLALVDGMLHELAGEHDKAVAILTPALKDCRFGMLPMLLVQGRASLARAHEALRDTAAACAGYEAVLERWGNAKPRSITADHARKRLTALNCKPTSSAR